MKKLLTLLFAIVAVPALAQQSHRTEFPLAIDWDLDSTSYVYPVSQGQPVATIVAGTRAEKVLLLPGIPGIGKIQTSGASTTVTATNTQAPFEAIQVGDFITVTQTGVSTPDVRDTLEGGNVVTVVVTAKASANSITVNQTVTLTDGVGFTWRRAYEHNTAGGGWVPVQGFDQAKFSITIINASTTSGIDVRAECRDNIVGVDTDSVHIVYPYPGATCGFGTLATSECTFTGEGVLNNLDVVIDGASGWTECRVGLKMDSTDDGVDTGADIEQIRVQFVGLVK